MNPSAEPEDAIRVAGLRKEYPTRAEPLIVLDGVDLCLRRGASVAVMGPSGSGKSTLLYILGTLERPSAGRVRLDGRDPFVLAEPALADFRGRQVGFIFQNHRLVPQCSVLENVLIPTLIRPVDRQGAVRRARELLGRVGLSGRLDYAPSELSGGESQRVAIARALINGPKILLCDEPTGNLDLETGDLIGDCFIQLQRAEQVAVVVVTHNPRFAKRFDRVLHLRNGRLMMED